MHALLLSPIASHGDLHPFVGLGQALRSRGHRVTITTGEQHEPLIRRLGFDYVPFGTREQFRALTEDPDLWHPLRGFWLIVDRVFAPIMRPSFEIVRERYVPGETVVAATPLALGARVAQEALGVPLATVLPQPLAIRSADAPPVFPTNPRFVWLPRSGWRLFYRAMDAIVADRALGPPINAFRAEFGLPPARRLMDWWHSPQLILGTFPAWFAPPQPDWPPQTRLSEFPLYDESDVSDLPDEAASFLDAGDPPIAFTPGTAMRQGRWFFEASIEACRLLGRRGILLSKFPEQVPTDLPDFVRYFDYIPLGRLLRRCAALVHHGGIGTTSQALAAGVPQLVMPLAFDQPDNARRVERLGVARSLRPTDYRGPAVARALKETLDSPGIAARCREVAGWFPESDPLAGACGAIEGLIPSPPASRH